MRVRQNRHDGGQAAVLMAMCLFTMVVFAAMAANYGILVNDRIRMQNTADLAAYAGAFEQARAMNRLTQINSRIYLTAYNLRRGLTCHGYPPTMSLDDILAAEPQACQNNGNPFLGDYRVFPKPGCSDGYNHGDPNFPTLLIDAAQAKMAILAGAFMIENHRAKETALRAARQTAERNFRGTSRPFKSSFYEWQPESPTKRQGPLVGWQRVESTFTWGTFSMPTRCGCEGPSLFNPFPDICVETHSVTIPTWFVKYNTGPTVWFPARVNGVPAKNFLDIPGRKGGYFGGDASNADRSDELVAFAVAKPFGGQIGSYDPNGNQKHMTFEVHVGPLSGSADTNGYDYDSFDDDNIEDNFIPAYRARLASSQDAMLVERQVGYGDSAEFTLEPYGPAGMKPIQMMVRDMARSAKVRPAKVLRYTAH